MENHTEAPSGQVDPNYGTMPAFEGQSKESLKHKVKKSMYVIRVLNLTCTG